MMRLRIFLHAVFPGGRYGAAMKASDDIIQQRVIDDLGAEDSLRDTTLGVSVRDAIVHLTGVVSTKTDSATAERIAAEAPGSKGVVNDLLVTRLLR